MILSKLLFKVVLLAIAIAAALYLALNQLYFYSFLTSFVVIYFIYDFYKLQQSLYEEMTNFIETVRYRDFSRYFATHKVSSEIKYLREGFNEVNSIIKEIAKEKETQYQYLQKMLEMVNTGILLFKTETGEVLWINESLKSIFDVPFMKNLSTINRRNPDLFNEINALKNGTSHVVTVSNKTKILLSATTFNTEKTHFKLVAAQNIEDALDENELNAWQKLLSVLTHEIMNSIAPISSLADTLKKRLHTPDVNLKDDLEQGIDTIKKRSEGLIRFTEVYRNLNKISSLTTQKVYIRDLFENVYQLLEPTLESKNIELDIILQKTNITAELDLALMEQVIINLILNAIEAVKNNANPQINLIAEKKDNKTLIKVSDNGIGISDEVIENIFVPFFSTRPEGSGIGLSICKQIVLLHKGNLQVKSIPNQGTVFTINL